MNDPGADRPSLHVSTYDAARALHMTPAGVRHLIATDKLTCTRLPSRRRELSAAAVLALANKRAAAGLVLVPPPVRNRLRDRNEPQQLPLFHVRPDRARMAKAALHEREAKHRRSYSDRRGV